MGTFTKSFSGMGGYIAADKSTIDYIRANSPASIYHTGLSPIITKQIITAFQIIDGSIQGRNKINKLIQNSNFFRSEMVRLGLHVYGDYGQPIIPVLIYLPSKVVAFSRECLKRGLAVVVVGFPATSIILARARFCISAEHTKEDLMFAVRVIEEVSLLIGIRYNESTFKF